MAKSKNSFFEDVVTISAKLPWWLGVSLAVIVYLILHQVAIMSISPATKVAQFGWSAGQTIIKVLATLGQYLLPLALIVGSILSLFSQRRVAYSTTETVVGKPTTDRVEPKFGGLDSVWDEFSRGGNSVEPEKNPNRWSRGFLESVEWKRFEDLAAEFYREKGISCETTTLGADGGIDLKLYQDDSGKPTALVQCKAWGQRKVGVKAIRELRGVMASAGIEKGFFITAGSFSDEAKKFAKENHITLIDTTLLLMMINRLSREAQYRLLKFTAEGDYTTPTCPSCGIKMVRRDSRRGIFWGCRHYPRCKQTLNMRKKTEAGEGGL